MGYIINKLALNPNEIHINGPINIVRLENKDDGKIIYIYMDYHVAIDEQTRCDNIFSKDIDTYFAENFYALRDKPITYDFFLELFLDQAIDKKCTKCDDIYIWNVVHFFNKIFKFSHCENKVMCNEIFQNIRLHYMDIRDQLEGKLDAEFTAINLVIRSIKEEELITHQDITQIISHLAVVRDHMEYILSLLADEEPNYQPDNDETIKYFINKITQQYQNYKVQQKILGIIDNLLDTLRLYVAEINSIIKRIDNHRTGILPGDHLIANKKNIYGYTYGVENHTTQLIIAEIINMVGRVHDEFFEVFFLEIMDIYFMRRLLDKSEITNSIVYVGASHATNYIYHLVSKFNYNITHTAYSKVTNIPRLNKLIKEGNVIKTRGLLWPNKLIQCSVLKGFPKFFE
jgi:hypothetical protein